MAIFNLKKKASDHEDHIERRLKKEHKPDLEEITEKQLEDYITDEEPQLTEKRLKDNRGGPDGTTEARLNSSSSKLMKHRDESTHIGDINKLEEQRLANKPVEKEKYTPASETPKAFRWWEGSQSADGLKLAQHHTKELRYEPSFGKPHFDAIDEDGEISKDWSIHAPDDEFTIDDTDDPEENFLDDDEEDDLLIDDDEKDIFDINDDIKAAEFEHLNYEENRQLGVVRGSVKTDSDILGNDLAISHLIDFIIEEHPNLENSLTPDSLDFSKAEQGIIRYLVKNDPDLEAIPASLSDIEASSKEKTVKAQEAIPSKKK